MREEWLNRKVEIEDAPHFASHLIGQTGHICPSGGYDIKPDEVFVKLSNSEKRFFYIQQLKFIDEE